MLASNTLRPDLSDRRTRLALGIAVLGALIAAFVYTIGTGDVRLTVAVAGVAIAPALLVLAIKRSYLFPYGLYIVLIPFDNMLKISGSGTLTKMLGIVSTLFIIVYAIRRKGLNQPPLTLYVWCGYVMWLLCSLLWTNDVSTGFTDAEQIISLVAMYAVLAVAPVEERDVRAVCTCIVLGGIAAAFYGMYLLHQNPVQTAGEYNRLMINVDDRTIDANHFANAMLAPIALSLVALLNARKPLMVLGSLFALTVLIGGVLMSLSREAMLAIVLIVVVVSLFSKRRVLAAAIGAPLLILTPILVPSIGVRMSDAFKTGGAGRTGIWEVGWRIFKQHPFFGVGSGGFIDAYNRNYLHVFQFYNAGWNRPPHNTLLHTAAELGVVGVLFVVTAFAVTFRQFRPIKRGDSLYDLRVAFTASLLGLALVSLFIDLLNYKYFWLALTTVAQMRTVVAMRRRAAPAPVLANEPVPALPVRRTFLRRRSAPAAP
ncbi:MAG: O-antigen ligase family protein [Candidatus Eremiobacteraeota bacterium]|nr:O-antigen ligase family protein [Candidatus Eremiobacteraeota bacterium]